MILPPPRSTLFPYTTLFRSIVKEHVSLVRQIGNHNVGTSVVIVIAEINSHAGESLAIFVVAHARKQTNFRERTIPIVVIQKALDRVIGDKDIGESIAIVVRKRDAESLAVWVGDSRLLRNICEGTVAIIVIKDVRESRVVVGMAIGANSQRRFLTTVAIVLECPIDVTRNE